MWAYLKSSLWVVPLIAIPVGMITTRILHWLDGRIEWGLTGFAVTGAQALLDAVLTSSLSFVVFTFGSLLVAIQVDGTIAGVRVLAHSETPGLGDYIDSAKSAWIKQFDGATLGPSEAAWKVKKDGGRFDYMTGATITPRAVIKAVHKALRYYEQHGAAIFAQPIPH